MCDEGFQYTQEQKSRNRGLRRKKFVTGTSASNTLQGALEPSRDLCVYRTVKKTEGKDISSYLCSKGIKERSVTKLSKAESKFASFKVEVQVSDMNSLLDSDFWPEGICVRRYFRPKEKSRSFSGWDETQVNGEWN